MGFYYTRVSSPHSVGIPRLFIEVFFLFLWVRGRVVGDIPSYLSTIKIRRKRREN